MSFGPPVMRLATENSKPPAGLRRGDAAAVP